MRRPQIIVAVLMTLTVATHASAQGRMMGRVEDADHHPIKGATIRATNANLSSSEWTSTASTVPPVTTCSELMTYSLPLRIVAAPDNRPSSTLRPCGR
jgi:hypothetical protein